VRTTLHYDDREQFFFTVTGIGATLQSTAALTLSNQWTSITSPIVIMNGQNTFTTIATNAATFYRLRRP